ncbi:MAG: DUF362 domain-containing protein [Clostridia bacterium]|nr:DUF362 domain-containing protein [Clostridia bacterium]
MVRFSPCPDYSPDHCRAALEAAAGDLSWVRPGMRVGIKLNLIHAAAPDAAATTHPALVKALTDLLIQRGATVVLGDSPGGLYNAAHLDRVYRVCGLEQLGAELNHDFSVKDGVFPHGKVLKRFQYTGWLDDCDEIINFCKLKTHGMMAMTCAVKNFFGTIPGTIKPEFHFRFPQATDFAHMLVDLQLYWKPRLHIVDAVTAMEGNGPTAGTPRELGSVLASENPFALDQICAPLIGLQPQQVPTQQAAMERGLVPDFPFPAELLSYCKTDFRLPPTKSTLFRSVLPGKAGELAGKAMQNVLSPRPTLMPDLCIGCGKCAALCPAKAIHMVKGKPRIHRSTCIRCFCCQEFCPKGALEARRSALAKVLTQSASPSQ